MKKASTTAGSKNAVLTKRHSRLVWLVISFSD